VSVEVFREIRIPFTSIRLSTARRDRAARRDAEVAVAEEHAAMPAAAGAEAGGGRVPPRP